MPLIIRLIMMAMGAGAGELGSRAIGKLLVGTAGKKAAGALEQALATKALSKMATSAASARAGLPAILRSHIPQNVTAGVQGLGRFAGSAVLGGMGGMYGYQLGEAIAPSEPAAEYQPHGAEALLGTPVHETGNDLHGLVSALESKLNSQSTDDDGEMDPQLEKLLAALNQQGKALV